MNRITRKRSDCFWGLHSDFHAKPEEGLVVGATLREEDIREICETLTPDFMQIDCKGHPGYTSYPSELGNAMPEFAFDTLALWRKVTREYGIPLYMHFSGVYDVKYSINHPEDCIIKSNGAVSTSARLDGDYADKYLIPQICELVDKYQIDGIWIDGDCWAVYPDYRAESLARFEEKKGISLDGKAPLQSGDPYYREYCDFTRETYREYLRHYVDVLHQRYPQLEICSNWAFSDHMPERVSADVDFLSGDLNPNDCVNSARYAARMLSSQGMTWDLMSWGFRFKIYGAPLVPEKTNIQLMQEAAAVISQGGAFQNNICQFPDGSPNIELLRKTKPLADFVLERRPYCFGGKHVHQAAMLVSTHDRYLEVTDRSKLSKVFDRTGYEKHMGLTALLCDSGQSLEIIYEHNLENDADAYPLIIVSELYEGLEAKTVEVLREYVMRGGSLLLIGTTTAQQFASAGFPFSCDYYSEVPEAPNFANCDIGHKKDEFNSKMPCYFSLDGKSFGVTEGAMSIVATDRGAKDIAFVCRSFRDTGTPFATVIPYGNGRVGVIGDNLGTHYNLGKQYLHVELIRNVTNELYEPLVKIESADGVAEISCLSLDGKLMIQIVNADGTHSDLRTVTTNRIPPLENISLLVKADKPPRNVTLRPENKKLAYEYSDGTLHISVDRVAIHSIVEIDV